QAEDGIRDRNVTGVQTCALPIWFTDRARRVVVLAQEEAKLLKLNYIGTEHILLGLIHEGEGLAAKALEGMDISLEQVRDQVQERSEERRVGKGERHRGSGEHEKE